jgi:ABC-type transport system involved in multi-copper enzyme maturation permease subunit
LVIASNVFREVIRDRVLYLVIFFALFLLGVNRILPYLSTLSSDKIFLDFGLGAIAILGLIVTVFMGTSLINQEIDRRTIIVLLAKPVSRVEFILGKHLGLSGVVAVLVTILTLFYLGILQINGVAYPLAAILIANGFLILELSLLVAVSILFSVWTGPLLALTLTLAVYGMGHLSQDFVKLMQLTDNLQLQQLASNVYLVLPDLSQLTLRNEAIYNALPDTMTLLAHASYGVAYTAILLVIATLIFLQREF